jgi:hypothetical protein
MLSYFPELLYLAPFAGVLLRLAVALVLGTLALHALRGENIWMRLSGVVSGLAALFLIAGALTQPMALIALLSIIESLVRGDRALPKSTLGLALVMSVALLITGPGPFAFDLPL